MKKTCGYFWSYLARFSLKWDTSIFQTEAVEKIKTHILCTLTFFSLNPAVYEIMKNIVEPIRPQMTIWRMHIACWRPKAIHTHLEYVILIALALQQWLHERISVLHYTRWFKYDRDWFVCKQAAQRSSCATLREWSHNLHPPSCSG